MDPGAGRRAATSKRGGTGGAAEKRMETDEWSAETEGTEGWEARDTAQPAGGFKERTRGRQSRKAASPKEDRGRSRSERTDRRGKMAEGGKEMEGPASFKSRGAGAE
jgi:hypothetical protein